MLSQNMLGDDALHNVCGPLKDLLEKLDGKEGNQWLEALKRFLRKEERPFVTVDWQNRLITKTQKLLSKSFGKKIVVDPLPVEFTEENLAKWEKYNLRPIFLPDEEIAKDKPLKNWIKLDKWFYQQMREGKIAKDSATLKRSWYLADFTIGADYDDGSQVFVNDPLSPIFERLRKEGGVGKYEKTPMGSRFSIISQNEWPLVLVEFAKEIGVNPEKTNLERAIEFNTIGNLYDKNRGKFNMWERFADVFEDSRRLCGGRRDCGGLAGISYRWSGHRDYGLAGRPLVSFGK